MASGELPGPERKEAGGNAQEREQQCEKHVKLATTIRVGGVHGKEQQDMERGHDGKQSAGDATEQQETEHHAQDVEEVCSLMNDGAS